MTARQLPLVAALLVGGAALLRSSPETPVPGRPERDAPPPARIAVSAPSEGDPSILSEIGAVLGSGVSKAGAGFEQGSCPPTSATDVEPELRREVMRWVARRLKVAYLHHDQQRSDRCARACDEILALDPNYPVARHLKAIAEGDLVFLILRREPLVQVRWIEVYRRLTDDDVEPRIPELDAFRFPSRAEWDRFQAGPDAVPRPEDPRVADVHFTLETVRVNLDLVDAKFEDVVALLRDFSGLAIVLDADARESVDPERRLDVRFRNILLKDALREAMGKVLTGLRYEVTDERVVLITDRPDPDRY
jgi:hypothetical protein